MTNRITKYLLEEKLGSPLSSDIEVEIRYALEFNLSVAYEALILMEVDANRKATLELLFKDMMENFAR